MRWQGQTLSSFVTVNLHDLENVKETGNFHHYTSKTCKVSEHDCLLQLILHGSRLKAYISVLDLGNTPASPYVKDAMVSVCERQGYLTIQGEETQMTWRNGVDGQDYLSVGGYVISAATGKEATMNELISWIEQCNYTLKMIATFRIRRPYAVAFEGQYHIGTNPNFTIPRDTVSANEHNVSDHDEDSASGNVGVSGEAED
jgi:hypothetical protein